MLINHTRMVRCCAFVLGLMCAPNAMAITIFACHPEWAALSAALLLKPLAVLQPGQFNITIHTATQPLQDPHHIEARPSLIAKLRAADFAICTGAELESGWWPTLQEKSGNPKVQDGKPTVFYAADTVRLINPHRGVITPFSGDVHAMGNPHIHTDPRHMLTVAAALAQRLGSTFPQHREAIMANAAQFQRTLSARIALWESQAQGLKGTTIVTQHATFAYLWAWLGITPVADLEPKPGFPPTAQHLHHTLKALQNPVANANQPLAPIAIVIAKHHDPKAAQWLVQSLNQHNTHARMPLLELPATVTQQNANALFDWYETLVQTLLKTLNPTSTKTTG